MSQLERAIRGAFRALAPIAEESGVAFTPEEELRDVDTLAAEYRSLADHVLDVAYVAQRGARHHWKTARREPSDWTPDVLTFDLDAETFDPLGPDADIYDPDADWFDTPLFKIASVYRGECGWDFSPDRAGLWLAAAAPTSLGWGGRDETARAFGNLVGFVVLHDRDRDDEYESIAHIWTARDWRRQGIASRLLADAQERYPVCEVEGPVTDAGGALIRARLSELVETP